jgi:hypothetical protein
MSMVIDIAIVLLVERSLNFPFRFRLRSFRAPAREQLAACNAKNKKSDHASALPLRYRS